MSMMQRPHRVAARGQPVPAGYMPAPPVLGPRGAEIWDEIQKTRPNFYGVADRTLLLSYCALAARFEKASTGQEECTANEFNQMLLQVERLAKVLRISPYARTEGLQGPAAPQTNAAVHGISGTELMEDGTTESPVWRRNA